MVTATRPHLVVLTGAGCSAESGLRTFRDHNGLWEGHRVQDVATPEAWARDPATVWRFYQLRRAQLRSAQPNVAHRALALAETALAGNMTLITQNVDNLHQRAGSTAIPMHGELAKLRCEACDHIEQDLTQVDPERFVPCPACQHSRLRPHIVWFGEIPLDMDAIETAMQRCTHFAAMGTSGAVYPAAGLLAQARDRGARTFVNSLDEPENLDPRDHFFAGPATRMAPKLLTEILLDMGVQAPDFA